MCGKEKKAKNSKFGDFRSRPNITGGEHKAGTLRWFGLVYRIREGVIKKITDWKPNEMRQTKLFDLEDGNRGTERKVSELEQI